jgi:S-methylmethionine-dependent homocysteine/selenocysteine methylase
VSVTAIAERDGVVRTAHGERVTEAFEIAATAPSVLAAGVNCCDPVLVRQAVRDAATIGIPAVAYPNSGETWDGHARRWVGDPRRAIAEAATWVDNGARLVGGCCRVTPADIAALADLINGGTDSRTPPRSAARG